MRLLLKNTTFVATIFFAIIALQAVPGTEAHPKREKKHGSRKSTNKSRQKPHKLQQALGMVIVKTQNTFEQTRENLESAIGNNPNINLMAEIDHSAAAKSVSLDLLPNHLYVFGNPALGTPLMEKTRKVGIDLPQKMLIWEEEDGSVMVGYNSVDYLAARHRRARSVESLDTVGVALKMLASVAAGVSPEQIDDYVHVSSKIKRTLSTDTSDADFDTTVERLLIAIKGSPADLAFTVDHSANSGGTLPPTLLLVFGNPKIGTPLMVDQATTGIDLPLKILVWEDHDGAVKVTSNTGIGFLAYRHDLSRRVKIVLRNISKTITILQNTAVGNDASMEKSGSTDTKSKPKSSSSSSHSSRSGSSHS